MSEALDLFYGYQPSEAETGPFITDAIKAKEVVAEYIAQLEKEAQAISTVAEVREKNVEFSREQREALEREIDTREKRRELAQMGEEIGSGLVGGMRDAVSAIRRG